MEAVELAHLFQGCNELAITISMTLGDLTVVNSDVAIDAEGLGDNGEHDVSDHSASVMFNAGHHARGWILAACNSPILHRASRQ